MFKDLKWTFLEFVDGSGQRVRAEVLSNHKLDHDSGWDLAGVLMMPMQILINLSSNLVVFWIPRFPMMLIRLICMVYIHVIYNLLIINKYIYMLTYQIDHDCIRFKESQIVCRINDGRDSMRWIYWFKLCCSSSPRERICVFILVRQIVQHAKPHHCSWRLRHPVSIEL